MKKYGKIFWIFLCKKLNENLYVSKVFYQTKAMHELEGDELDLDDKDIADH